MSWGLQHGHVSRRSRRVCLAGARSGGPCVWQGGCVWDGRSVVPEVARAGRLQLAVSCERSVQPPAAAAGARPGHASGGTGICVSLRRSVDEAASCSDPRFLEQRNWCRSGYFHESSCRFPSYSSVVDMHTRRYSRQVNVRHVSSKRSALVMPSLATGANIVGGPRRGALPCRPEPPGTRVGDAASGQWRLGRSRLTRRARARASASGNARGPAARSPHGAPEVAGFMV